MLAAWMTGIVGVIALGVLLQVLLPEGQTGKYVKGAFSLLVIFVIVAPLPSVASALKDWEPTYTDIAPDYGFIEDSAELFERSAALKAQTALAEEGYDAEVKVVVKEGSVSDIESVDVTLRLPVLSESELNKHIANAAAIAARASGADVGCVRVTVSSEE